MDVALILLAFALMVLGILGCVLPGLAGPPLSFAGLVALHLTKSIDLTSGLLWVMAVLTVVVSILDYVLPVWGTRRFGGTKYGSNGAMAGLIVGFVLGPMGLITGPFIGALVGEMLGGRRDRGMLRAAFGSFMGFLMSLGLKLILSLAMLFYWFVYVIPLIF